MKLVGILGGCAAVGTWLVVDMYISRPSVRRVAAASREEVHQPTREWDDVPRLGKERPVEKKQEVVRTPEADQHPGELNDVGVILEEQFRIDPPSTRESYERVSSLEGLFKEANLGDKAKLTDVICKGTICRGEIEIANESFDNMVFNRTFLSQEFVRTIDGAISVSERRKLDDGRVIATFFIHPDSSLNGLPDRGDEEAL